MPRTTDATVVPFTTSRTCTLAGCDCNRDHPNAPAPDDGFDWGGDAA